MFHVAAFLIGLKPEYGTSNSWQDALCDDGSNNDLLVMIESIRCPHPNAVPDCSRAIHVYLNGAALEASVRTNNGDQAAEDHAPNEFRCACESIQKTGTYRRSKVTAHQAARDQAPTVCYDEEC